jgi:hypothetical protein
MMDSGPQDPSAPAGGAAEAIGSLACGVVISSINAKLRQNSTFKDPCMQCPWTKCSQGTGSSLRLVKAVTVTANTWEVVRTVGSAALADEQYADNAGDHDEVEKVYGVYFNMSIVQNHQPEASNRAPVFTCSSHLMALSVCCRLPSST